MLLRKGPLMRSVPLSALFICLVSFGVVLAEHSPGESVRIRWGGKEVVAEVVSVDSKSGWIKVKFQQNGIVLTPALPPEKVFADSKEYAEAQDAKLQKLLEQLRTNSDGKNVSTTEYRPWHGPGRAGQKYGPVLFTARVKAFRAGSSLVLFETIDRKKKKQELVVKFETIGNADRGYLAQLLRNRKKK
jgi:hypothetical protein